MASKGRKRQKKTSVEDIYCNTNFVPPKEKNLETIFEEPRKTKDGVPMLTSVKKYKRYLHFDPTQNKIQKRKRNSKKCVKKLKNAYRITRSSPKDSEIEEMSLYLDVLDDSSSDSDRDISSNLYSNVTTRSATPAKPNLSQKRFSSDSHKESSCSDVFDTPKKSRSGLRRLSTGNPQEIRASKEKIVCLDDKTDLGAKDAGESNVKNEDLASPRSSCCVS